MGRKKQTPLTMPEKVSVTLKAQHAERMKSITALADKMLAMKAGESYAMLNTVLKEAIIYRIQGGDTLNAVCKQLGISTGVVCQAAYLDPDGFGKELVQARANGAFTLADTLLEIPFDENMSSADKKIYSDNIKYYVSRMNREAFGDTVKVDQTVTVQPVQMPDWSFGNVIDVTPSTPGTDPDAEE